MTVEDKGQPSQATHRAKLAQTIDQLRTRRVPSHRHRKLQAKRIKAK